MWGNDSLEEDFCWPTDEMLHTMPLDVSLQSIELIRVDGAMSYVVCTLSDGRSSGIIGRKGLPGEDQKTAIINFSDLNPVRNVEAAYDGYLVDRIRFMDINEKELDCYNPVHQKERKRFTIGEDEKLIGVYGTRAPYYGF